MSTPAGWYDDGHGTQRWWNGTAWTEHVQPAVAEAVPDAAPPGPAEPAAPAPAAPEDASPAQPSYAAPAAPEYAAPAEPQYAAPAQPEYAAAPVVPPGYPPAGGYPGAAGYAPAPEQAPKKSKLWILWVVLGGVVVLLIVAAAILVPLLIGLFSSAGGGATGSNDDERAAVDAVLLYDDAFDDADCTLYEQSTTSAFRETYGYADCDSFEAGAETFDENTDDYDVTVTGVETRGDGTVIVTTMESYLSNVDADGNPLDTPQQSSDPFEYTLVDDGGRWAIDDVQ